MVQGESIDRPVAVEEEGPRVCIFAPAPVVTVTVESGEGEEGAEVHFHAGGQGVWVARMVRLLGARPRLCGPLGGESGNILSLLIAAEGVDMHPVAVDGPNGVYVHDRREGERVVLAETRGHKLSRHEIDDLYSVTVAEGITAGVTVLTGSGEGGAAVPAGIYGRLASDLRGNGVTTVADLSGEPLRLLKDIDVLKVSHEELLRDNKAPSDDVPELRKAMESLQETMGGVVIVSRAEQPALVLMEGRLMELVPPRFEAVDHRGAGDSMTAAVAAGLALGLDLPSSLKLAGAASALNVTRHGLGTGHKESVEQLADAVELRELEL